MSEPFFTTPRLLSFPPSYSPSSVHILFNSSVSTNLNHRSSHTSGPSSFSDLTGKPKIKSTGLLPSRWWSTLSLRYVFPIKPPFYTQTKTDTTLTPWTPCKSATGRPSTQRPKPSVFQTDFGTSTILTDHSHFPLSGSSLYSRYHFLRLPVLPGLTLRLLSPQSPTQAVDLSDCDCVHRSFTSPCPVLRYPL